MGHKLLLTDSNHFSCNSHSYLLELKTTTNNKNPLLAHDALLLENPMGFWNKCPLLRLPWGPEDLLPTVSQLAPCLGTRCVFLASAMGLLMFVSPGMCTYSLSVFKLNLSTDLHSTSLQKDNHCMISYKWVFPLIMLTITFY